MSDIHGILLTEKEETITVMAPGVVINITIDWEKRQISEINHKRTSKPVDKTRTDWVELKPFPSMKAVEEYRREGRKPEEYNPGDFPNLILPEEFGVKITPQFEAAEADWKPEEYKKPVNGEVLPKEEKIIMPPFQPVDMDIEVIETKKKRAPYKNSRPYIDRSRVREAILEYGRKKGGKFTFRVSMNYNDACNEEARQEAIDIQKETGFNQLILREVMKTLLNEGIITRARKSGNDPYTYEIKGEAALKKDNAPDAAGGLK